MTICAALLAPAGEVPATPANDLAQLFGPAILPGHGHAVLEELGRDCALIEAAPFQPGEIIGGRYEVQTIHRGGCGLVYICRFLGPDQYARSGNLVALKTPLPRHLANPEFREMFLEEAAHCVALGPHPNLVLAYGVVEFNRLPYLVLEYIPGARSLGDDIIAGRTDWRSTLRIGLGVARGLAYAGLVHRDLNPKNILLGPDGTARVADFGLSLTSGEAARRGACSPATDLFALGVALYISATRQFPFGPQEYWPHGVDPAPNPRDIVAEIPSEFARLIQRCLDPDPNRRPGTFDALTAELEDLHHRLLETPPADAPFPDVPTRADALVNAAQSWINLGRLAEAREAVREALRLQPENWKAHCALGNALLEANDPSAALASFHAAHEFATAEIEPMTNAALAAGALDRTDEARRWLTLAIHHCAARDCFAQLDGCSGLAIELLDEKEAYHLIHRILTEDPRAAITWNNRAVLMRRMGAPELALESAGKALALNPTYAKAYVQEANALLELGRNEEAMESADRALALDATLAGAYAARFSALATLGKFADAEDCIDRGLSVLPGNELLLSARRKLRDR